jgi:hypothetical protein
MQLNPQLKMELASVFVEELIDQYQCTPDMWQLEQHEMQLLFVYDEMMEGHFRHDLIKEHCVRVADVYSRDKFQVYKKCLGKVSFPIPFQFKTPHYSKGNQGTPELMIRGTLYAIRPYQYRELDNYKLNGIQFNRVRTRVVLPYYLKNKETGVLTGPIVTLVRCWMYIGVADWWLEHMTNDLYKPVLTYQPNNPFMFKYYYFSLTEYNV